MSLRHNRAWFMLGLFLAGDVWALGLGDIRLNSALNEPLRAEIGLLSATPEELAGLKVQLAPAATFERYGIDRPHFLTRLEFSVVNEPQSGAARVRIRSSVPVTEPFVTFLVEASWPSGRLLREYTVLLDPPIFAPPPAASSSQPVSAPRRAAQQDSGRIERPAEQAQAPRAAPAAGSAPATTSGGELYVQRGDTLWDIASRARPDNRVGMNQMMLAIYEANPQAFGGNLNRLNAGATLSIPSEEAVFRISRNDALSEVQRQNAAWGGVADSSRAQPSLTLVPPDGEQADFDSAAAGASGGGANTAATAARIRDLEATIAEQDSLIEIRDNELAQLRDELTRLRNTQDAAVAPAEADAEDAAAVAAEPDVAETDELFVDDSEIAADQAAAGIEETEEAAAEPAAATTQRSSPQVVASRDEPGLVDRILGAVTGALSGFWGILGAVLLLVIGLLVWLAKRAAGRGEEDSTGMWEALDSDEEIDTESRASTERLRALARDDDSTIVVVEQERGRRRGHAETQADGSAGGEDTSSEASAPPAIEDTFSSETAINLDQSDPIAEADFHMAYGLYDQAADLINGALAADPERQDLMSKLCEIYFVWGNRDAFVDAASRLHDQMGGEGSPEWDKIVIMGQQIAGDHKLFSGVSAGAATRAVDLSFDSDEGDGALDMDFASGPDGEVSEVIDVGGEGEEDSASPDYSGLDFVFDEDAESGETITREIPKGELADDETVESSALRSGLADTSVDSPTVESPTMERPLDDEDGTSELPSVSDADDYAAQRRGDATAEIDLDDLGLDLDALAKTGLDADIDDADEDAANSDFSDLEETSENRALKFDPDATGKNRGLDDDDESSPFDLDDLEDLTGATSEMPSFDETGKNPAVDFDNEGTDAGIGMDTTLLDATGHTQVLSGDIGVNTTTGDAASKLEDDDKTTLSPAFDDDAETFLSSVDGKDDKEDEEYEATAALQADDLDFDFTKTEALPKGAFDKDSASAQSGTGRSDSSEVDLDLDDLTSALRFSDGDTVDQPRDDATVEQPIARGAGKSHQFVDLDFGDLEEEEAVSTAQLAPEDLSDDLHDARTMTEVGTKLDLARAYVDMGDPDGARSILEEVLDEGDDGQRQQAQHLIDTLPA